MDTHFRHINEWNKSTMNKPVNSDMVYYSELNEWYTSNAFRSFSLKYVLDRSIQYKVGNKEYTVKKGQFLVACRQPYVKAYFESGEVVKSICIDIRPETVAEAYTAMTAAEKIELDNFAAHYFKEPYFFESVSPLGRAPFREELENLVRSIQQGEPEGGIQKEWFMNLVEKLICYEYGNFLSLNGIQSVKPETRKEILRRLYVARDYMDNCFLQIEDVTEVATLCNLSEFHFYRSFKQAFRQTPYQYMMEKRIAHAKKLLNGSDITISEIAHLCNFPDLYTFSKAFKRSTGVPPSFLRLYTKT